ncbi:MAG: hypothetical protein MUO82_10805 [Candidatus Thermoplasmatota archaeon]|nr:hypothetical protein [Candidatus Thermoplasmatota archaeon]
MKKIMIYFVMLMLLFSSVIVFIPMINADDGNIVYKATYGSVTPYYTPYHNGSTNQYFFAEGNTGIGAYSTSNGYTMTLKDTDCPDARDVYGVTGDGTYIYTTSCTGALADVLRAYTFDGSTLTLKNTTTICSTYEYINSIAVNSDDILFVPRGRMGISAYTFDGTDFTELDNYDDGNNQFLTVCIDSDNENYVWAVEMTTYPKIYIYFFFWDGNTFSVTDSYQVTACFHLEDMPLSNYVCGSGSTTGTQIYAYDGFDIYTVDSWDDITGTNYGNEVIYDSDSGYYQIFCAMDNTGLVYYKWNDVYGYTQIQNIDSGSGCTGVIINGSYLYTSYETNGIITYQYTPPTTPSMPTDVYVWDNAPSGWLDESHVRTITEGIANVSENGTVHVWDGTYTENGLYCSYSESIIGNSSNTVTIEGDSNDIIFIDSNNITISGLNIANGSNAITINNNYDNITITDNILSYDGYGININNLNVTNFIIKNNIIYSNYYGVSFSDGGGTSSILVYNNHFYDNTYNANSDGYSSGEIRWNTTKTLGTNIYGGGYMGGNWWDDYTGLDLDGDRLGDQFLPYNNSGLISIGGDYEPLTGFADDCLNLTWETQLPYGCALGFRDYVGFVEMQYIPLGYNQYIDGTIDEVRLLVSLDQIEYVSDLPEMYQLVIDGEYIGTATGINVNYEMRNHACGWQLGDSYWITWSNIGKVINDDFPIFAFCSSQTDESGNNWHGLGLVSNLDLILHGMKNHFDVVKFNNALYDGNQLEVDMILQFDIICQSQYIPPEDTNQSADYKNIKFKFYDKATNNLLHFKGLNVPDSTMGNLNFLSALIYSIKSTNGFTTSYSLTDDIELTMNFTEGEYVDFYIQSTGGQDFNVRINNVFSSFKAMKTTLQLYQGQTYTIYIEPYNFVDGVQYTNCGGDDSTEGQISVCLSKTTYDYGETVRGRYTLPTGAWLNSHGWLRSGWYFAFFNRDDYTWGFGRTNNWLYVNRIELTPSDFDGTRHTFEFEIKNYNQYGYDQFYNDYEVAIINYKAGFWDYTTMFQHLIFYCTGSNFIPDGNITSVSPNPCNFGQEVTIAFTSNGVGDLKIKYPNGDLYFSVPYGYSSGVHTISKTMSGLGSFSIELYTDSPFLNETVLPVDTETLVVNPLGGNGTYGSYGYGLPYLYIPNYRVIAGFDTIQIYYRTYKNNSILKIISPRNETTYFSTTVSNQSDNVLNIPIPNYMQIGNWNVTFHCGDIDGNNETLYTSFNVVNEEGNWVEFTKHIFTTNEMFSIYIKHTYRVSITFYKNNIAQGESLIFDVGISTGINYNIPLDIIMPSIGNWRVEMWRINDRNIVKLLAEHECTVIYATPIKGDGGIEISLPLIINGFIPSDWQFVLGLIIIIFCFVIIAVIGKKLDVNNMPSLVYLISGIAGFIIDIKLELFDFWMTVIFAFTFTVLVIWNIFGSFGMFSGGLGSGEKGEKREKVRTEKQSKPEKSEKATESKGNKRGNA